jgi:hypothetical protein
MLLSSDPAFHFNLLRWLFQRQQQPIRSIDEVIETVGVGKWE